MIDEAFFNVTMGARLRAARRRRGWSLTEVERLSHAEFKASVLGAYERGERSLSVQRLARLAELYGVPPHQLIPAPEEGGSPDRDEIVVDLSRLEGEEGAVVLDRFLSSIHLMRRPDSDDLAVRQSDLAILSSMLRFASADADPA